MTARLLAYELLIKCEKNRQFSNIALDNALLSCDLCDADKRLASTLFYGVIEKRISLDYKISTLSSRKLDSLEPSVLTAIRLGIYQLAYLDRIPAHAAINEAVALFPKKAKGFVNAILRQYERTPVTELPSVDTPIQYLSVKYSVGEPLAKKLIEVFGMERAEDILGGFEFPTRTTVRVNTLKTSREHLMERLEGAEETELSSTGLYVKGALRELFGYDEGLFFVQDQASQICVEALGAREGDVVIDVCACPGSKSFGAAIDMKNTGSIKCYDLHQNKLSLVLSSARRLGISIIDVEPHDGRELIDGLVGTADRVICDVPCSGFGVLSKKPELRYKDPAGSERLPKIQRQILNTACRYVRSGGVLVYSTCTIFPEENEHNVMEFLRDHPEFELCAWSSGGIVAEDGMITLYPHVHKTDGFFIAKLLRK